MNLKKSVRCEVPECEHAAPLAPQVVDALLEGYVAWREESASAAESYESWNRATVGERDVAYTAYIAALDREEAAARTYRDLIEQARAA